MSQLRSDIASGDSGTRGARLLMYIRCAQCNGSTQVPPSSVGRDVVCEKCGREHSLERAHLLGSTPLERHEKILEYSDAHRVDLASACSILLGIMSPRDAIVVGVAESGRAEKAPEQNAALDPGFTRAIAEGFITRSEALQRGNRNAYASGIAQHHKLPFPLALLVADNRLTLERALGRNKEVRSSDEPCNERVLVTDAPEDRSFWMWLLIPFLVLLGVLAVLNQQHRRAAPADLTGQAGHPIESRRNITPLARIEPVVQRHATDAVTRITAAHPRDVLVAFCNSTVTADARVPLRVEPSGDNWIGVYEEAGRTFRLFIQRDMQDARLFSTDGRPPIEWPQSQNNVLK